MSVSNVVAVKAAPNRVVGKTPDNPFNSIPSDKFTLMGRTSWIQSRIDCGDLVEKGTEVPQAKASSKADTEPVKDNSDRKQVAAVKSKPSNSDKK